MARTRPRLAAAERGYGHEHRAARAAAIRRFTPGQPCASCGRPITTLWMTDRKGRIVSAVDLGHEPGTGKTRYRGLEHRSCNRSGGAAYGNRLRGVRRGSRQSTTPAPSFPATALRTSRQW
jgi:hypothetical protein